MADANGARHLFERPSSNPWAALGGITAKTDVMLMSADVFFLPTGCPAQWRLIANAEFRPIQTIDGHLALLGADPAESRTRFGAERVIPLAVRRGHPTRLERRKRLKPAVPPIWRISCEIACADPTHQSCEVHGAGKAPHRHTENTPSQKLENLKLNSNFEFEFFASRHDDPAG